MIPNYKILTEHKVGDFDSFDSEKLYEEQEAKCKEIGIDTSGIGKEYVIRFFDSEFYNEETVIDTVYDAIQCLAIKEGVNLVQYENGNVGFIGYYGQYRNGFEIIGDYNVP